MAISPLPTPPQRSDPTNFPARADAFMSALPTFGTEANALQVDVNAKQVIASNAATDATTQASIATASASAATAAASATLWVSGTTYLVGDCRFSPINYQTYRRTTSGAGTTDPSADSTNWVQISSAGMTLLTTVTPSVGTTISLPNIFTSAYDNYLVMINDIGLENLGQNLGDIVIQMCVGGSVVGTTNYVQTGANNTSTTGFPSTSFAMNSAGVIATTTSVFNAEVKIKNVNSTRCKSARVESEYDGYSGGVAVQSVGSTFGQFSGGVVTGFVITANTAFVRFYPRGKVRVYGYNN